MLFDRKWLNQLLEIGDSSSCGLRLPTYIVVMANRMLRPNDHRITLSLFMPRSKTPVRIPHHMAFRFWPF